MSRETRRHPLDPNLQALPVSKKSVIPKNEIHKNNSKNSSESKGKRKSSRHLWFPPSPALVSGALLYFWKV